MKTMAPAKVFWLKLQIQKENMTQHASHVAKISYQFQVTLQNKLIRAQCLPVYMLLSIPSGPPTTVCTLEIIEKIF